MPDTSNVTPIKPLQIPKPPKRTRMTREVEHALGWHQTRVFSALSILELADRCLEGPIDTADIERARQAIRGAAILLRPVDTVSDAIALQQLGEKLLSDHEYEHEELS